MRKIFFALLILSAYSPLFALTVEVDRIDGGSKYAAIKDTDAVQYVDRCARGKFDAYEWKTWEGYYSARAFVEPIAVITIKRGPHEFLGGNLDPYIKLAQGETGRIGGNLVCYVQIRKNKRLLEPDAMIFRAYKQLFQSGNSAWEAYFGEIMSKGILLTLDDLKEGVKTKDIKAGTVQLPPPKQ